MIYLASPYCHPDPSVREQRFRAACQATAHLLRAGHLVFSPIVHGHPLVEHGVPVGWEFWKCLDQSFVGCCDEIVVLQLDGWDASAGIDAEVRLGRALGKPVRFVVPEAVGVAVGSPTAAYGAGEGTR